MDNLNKKWKEITKIFYTIKKNSEDNNNGELVLTSIDILPSPSRVHGGFAVCDGGTTSCFAERREKSSS
jgi:hypothetical protein